MPIFRMKRAETAVEEMGSIVEQHRERLSNSKQIYLAASTAMTGLPAAYVSLIAAIDAQAAANPNSVEFKVLKGRKDQFIAEAASVGDYATALRNAIAGVNEQ